MVREIRNPGAGGLKELPEPQTEMKPLVRRTALQRKADSLDRDLYRLLCRVEDLYDQHKRDEQTREYISDSLSCLRGARVGLRCLMHKRDRERTI